jgi:hypothetical protein
MRRTLGYQPKDDEHGFDFSSISKRNPSKQAKNTLN